MARKPDWQDKNSAVLFAFDALTSGFKPVEVNANGDLAVSTAGTPAALDTRIARFDAAADMPVDITSAANVTADRFEVNTVSSTARRFQVLWHGPTGFGYDGTGLVGPICMAAFITINAGDDATADTRLTYTDFTGGGTSTSGKTDLIVVSMSNPKAEFILDTALLRADGIGIPVGVTLNAIVPAFVEIRAIG